MTLGIIFGILIGLAITLTLAPFLARPKGGKKKEAAARKKTFGVLAAFVVFLSVGIYFHIGRPDLANPPSLPKTLGDDLFTQQGGQPPSIDIMVERLKAYLQENPGDVEGWSRYGQALMLMNRFDEAITAYQQAIVITPANPQLHSALGEALTLAGDGFISEAAVASFENALRRNPNDAISHYYLGEYSYQQGDVQAAYDRWAALHAAIPEDTPWLALLEQRLFEAASALDIPAPASKIPG